MTGSAYFLPTRSEFPMKKVYCGPRFFEVRDQAVVENRPFELGLMWTELASRVPVLGGEWAAKSRAACGFEDVGRIPHKELRSITAGRLEFMKRTVRQLPLKRHFGCYTQFSIGRIFGTPVTVVTAGHRSSVISFGDAVREEARKKE